jgi:hypothetical protein
MSPGEDEESEGEGVTEDVDEEEGDVASEQHKKDSVVIDAAVSDMDYLRSRMTRTFHELSSGEDEDEENAEAGSEGEQGGACTPSIIAQSSDGACPCGNLAECNCFF